MNERGRRRYGTGSLMLRGKTFWVAYHAQGKLVRESAKTGIKKEAEAFLRVTARPAAVECRRTRRHAGCRP